MLFSKIKTLFKIKRKRISPAVFKEYYFKKRALEEQISKIKILAMGSSYCAQSLNTDLIDDAFNLGTIDQDLYTTHFLFKKYILQIQKLKKLLIFYGVFSPGHELEKTHSFKKVACYHYVFGIPYNVDYLIQYEKSYLHHLKKIYMNFKSSTGYLPPDQAFAKKPISAKIRVQSHLKNNQRGTNQTRYLDDIYKICQQRDIKMYVIIAPVRSDYIKALGDRTDKELYHELFEFANKRKVPVMNAMRHPDFSDEEFYDCNHLNAKGAIHFTKLVKEFIS